MGKPAPSPAQVKRWFVGALLVAAGVRSYLLGQYYCISSDGVTYLRACTRNDRMLLFRIVI